MKKIYKIIVYILIIALFAGGYFIYASFYGSAIKKAIITNRAKIYFKQNYNEQEYVLEKARYNFKDGIYSCYVRSSKSPDRNFDIFEDRNKEIKDDFEDRVIGGWNTYRRLSSEMDNFMDTEIKRIYPHKTELCILSFYEEKEDALSKLSEDMPMNIENPVHPLSLTVWVQGSENPSWEELADKLREIVNIMDNEGYNISYYSMSLYYPEKDNTEKPSSRIANIDAFNVPKSVIESDELTKYLDDIRIKQERELEEIKKGNMTKE